MPLWRLSHGWPRSECHIWNSKYSFSSGQAIPCTHIPDPSAVVDLCMRWVQSMGIACSNWAPHPRLVLVLWTSSAAIFPEHAAVQRHILLWKFVTSSNFPKWIQMVLRHWPDRCHARHARGQEIWGGLGNHSALFQGPTSPTFTALCLLFQPLY